MMIIPVWKPGMSAEDAKNVAYWERNVLASLLVHIINDVNAFNGEAPNCGWYPHEGEGFEGWSRVVSIFGGGATWHVPDDFDLGDMPRIEPNWDGHTTVDKYALITRMLGMGVQRPDADEPKSNDPLDSMTAEEIVELIGNELEDANYHSVTGVPRQIYDLVSPVITNEKILHDMFKKMYNQRTFFE